jgi:hypothetical protein
MCTLIGAIAHASHLAACPHGYVLRKWRFPRQCLGGLLEAR